MIGRVIGDIARRATDRSKAALCARMVLNNYRFRRRFSAGMIEAEIGSSKEEPLRRLRYGKAVFADYLAYGGALPQDLAGKSVLELGPGDTATVALLFAAAGAQRVVCLDKFYSRRDQAAQQRIYEILRADLNGPDRARFDAAVQLGGRIEFNPEVLETVYGVGVEDAAALLGGAEFDYVVSRAVLEEVYDIEGAFRSMDHLLKPGGMMIHKIDLSDYGQFSKRGFSPLEFLTIPDFVYRRMSRDSGLPNRQRASFYRQKLEDSGYDVKIWITSVMEKHFTPHVTTLERGVHYTAEDIAAVAEIRGRLCRQFQSLSDEELLTTGIFVAARKRSR